MSHNTEDFQAQWRASAHEAVPYTNDFPECFLVLPELIDGAIGQGTATKIIIEIKFIDDNIGYLKVTDNGIGVKNSLRLLSWAAKESTSIHHRYGHGSKKCLTKWNKDYNSKWYVKYRFRRQKGVDTLFQYNSPFIGNNPDKIIQDDENESDLMPSGLEWYMEFKRDILNNKNTIKSTFDSIKEIIRTRYSRYYFNKTEFVVKVYDDIDILEENSKLNKWTTFEEEVINEINKNNCKEFYNKEIDFGTNTKVTYKVYYLTINGGKSFDLKKDFQTYGHKNMLCSRIYISINQRVIEIAPFWKFIKDRDANHNSLNGIFAFINFENLNKNDNSSYVDELPTPCTTKVSFYENCKNFIKIREILFDLNSKIIKDISKIIPEHDEQKLDKPMKVIESNMQEEQINKMPTKISKINKINKKTDTKQINLTKNNKLTTTKSTNSVLDYLSDKNIKLSEKEDNSDDNKINNNVENVNIIENDIIVNSNDDNIVVDDLKYFYLIYINDICKIGKTSQDPFKRLKAYGPNYKIYLILQVKSDDFENLAINKLLENGFTQVKRNGGEKEWFTGDINKIKKCIIELYNEYEL